MEGIEYIPERGLDKQPLLRLASCAYIDEGHHVILKETPHNREMDNYEFKTV